MTCHTFPHREPSLPKSHWRYSRREDRTLVRRKMRGERDKTIARDLGRTAASVNNRWRVLLKLLAEQHGDIIERHRAEELQLLEDMLAEACSPELLGGER